MIELELQQRQQVIVPNIYFWTDKDITGRHTHMTCAFVYRSKAHGALSFGETWPIDKDWSIVSQQTYQKKLCGKMVETLDVLIHHGDRILDKAGNIDPGAVRNAEAERFWLDKKWADRLGAFTQVVKVKVISFEKAKELELI